MCFYLRVVRNMEKFPCLTPAFKIKTKYLFMIHARMLSKCSIIKHKKKIYMNNNE